MYFFKHNNSIIKYNNGYLIKNFHKKNVFFLFLNKKTIKVAYTDQDLNVQITKLGKEYVYYEKNKFYLIHFKTYMIVYEKSEKRIEHYNHINNLFSDKIHKFNAIDTIIDNDSFHTLSLKYLHNNTITKNYIRNVIFKYKDNYVLKGKLGVLLSHINLLKQILSEEKTKDWFLIMEDDVHININNDITQVINKYIYLISKSNPKCKYIKFFIHSDNETKQFDEKNKIIYNFYKLNKNQWSNVIYLIHYEGIKILLDNLFPIDTYFDKSISDYYDILDGITVKNDIFSTIGAMNRADNKSELGSIIYNIS